jgi:hypothetical protein
MELKQQEDVINIPVGDLEHLEEVVDAFNESYKTNFQILGSEYYDGVEFAYVKKNGAKDDLVFLLGYFYGGKMWRVRQENPHY